MREVQAAIGLERDAAGARMRDAQQQAVVASFDDFGTDVAVVDPYGVADADPLQGTAFDAADSRRTQAAAIGVIAGRFAGCVVVGQQQRVAGLHADAQFARREAAEAELAGLRTQPALVAAPQQVHGRFGRQPGALEGMGQPHARFGLVDNQQFAVLAPGVVEAEAVADLQLCGKFVREFEAIARGAFGRDRIGSEQHDFRRADRPADGVAWRFDVCYAGCSAY